MTRLISSVVHDRGIQKVTAWMAIPPSIAAGLLVASYIFLYRGGFPNINGGHASTIYFKEIAKRTEAKFIEPFKKSA